MLPEKIMQSDLLDILFENRNKDYGAYALRKSYNKRMIASIGCTLLVALLFSILQSFHHLKTGVITVNIIPPDPELVKLLPDKHEIPQSSHTQKLSHVKQVVNSTPQIVSDNDKIKPLPTTDELDKAVIGPVPLNGKDDEGIIQPPVELNKGTGIITTPVTEKIADDKPLKFAEVMPEFPGGTSALIKFILKNIHQPDDLQPGEQIKVVASLVVSKTGAVENVKIISGGRADLDKEVLRVINKMPLWKPGLQNGKAVSVYFNLPVTFKTANELQKIFILPPSLNRMENNYENNRRKSYITMRMVYDFTMAGLILGVSVIFFFGDRFSLPVIGDLDPVLRFSFAGLCLLYGSFRLYRGIKHDY